MGYVVIVRAEQRSAECGGAMRARRRGFSGGVANGSLNRVALGKADAFRCRRRDRDGARGLGAAGGVDDPPNEDRADAAVRASWSQ